MPMICQKNTLLIQNNETLENQHFLLFYYFYLIFILVKLQFFLIKLIFVNDNPFFSNFYQDSNYHIYYQFFINLMKQYFINQDWVKLHVSFDYHFPTIFKSLQVDISLFFVVIIYFCYHFHRSAPVFYHNKSNQLMYFLPYLIQIVHLQIQMSSISSLNIDYNTVL